MKRPKVEEYYDPSTGERVTVVVDPQYVAVPSRGGFSRTHPRSAYPQDAYPHDGARAIASLPHLQDGSEDYGMPDYWQQVPPRRSAMPRHERSQHGFLKRVISLVLFGALTVGAYRGAEWGVYTIGTNALCGAKENGLADKALDILFPKSDKFCEVAKHASASLAPTSLPELALTQVFEMPLRVQGQAGGEI